MVRAPETLATDRLVLRLPALSDAEAIFEYGSDPEVARYMDWPMHETVGTVVEHLRTCAPRWESGEEFYWVITARPDDRAIGGISVRVRGHAADFGYVLNRRYWRQGIATEASRAVVEWAFTLASVHRVWATCDVDNIASARVLEKAGLSREGILRCWAVRPNLSPQPRDAYVYAKVRGDGLGKPC